LQRPEKPWGADSDGKNKRAKGGERQLADFAPSQLLGIQREDLGKHGNEKKLIRREGRASRQAER